MANFMKSKIFLSVLFLGLAAFVIGGVTMAWFTDDANLEAAEFTAGTVQIDVDGKPVIKVPKGKSFDNVNPGDCATVIWEFENTGSKAVQLRVNLTEEWSDPDLSVDSVFYCPVDMDPDEPKGWVMVDDDEGDIWLYYIDKSSGELGSVRGTYNPANPEEPLPPEKVKLKLVVVFDRELVDNDYQGETYTIGGEGSKVYAIQASNKAPDTQWDEWTEVIGDYVPDEDTNAGDNYYYFHGGAGTNSDCWRYHQGKPPIDPTKYYVTISYLPDGLRGQEWEQWDEDETVDITAPAMIEKEDGSKYKFVKWSVASGLDEEDADIDGRNIQFTMPGNHVGLIAHYEKEAPPLPTEYDCHLVAAPAGDDYTKVNGKVENLKINGQLWNGDYEVLIEVTDGSITVSKAVTLTFENGDCNFSSMNIEVHGVVTNDNDNVAITINGVRKTNKS